MFNKFIKSLKRPGNEALIESVLKGYDVIFENRTHGKKLSEYPRYQFSKSVSIFRARDTKDNNLNTDDYVTLSPKFAVEHAESTHVYEEDPQQVIKAIVHPNLLVDASNPGEYFYIGKPIEGKSVYVSKGDEYEGEIPKNLTESIGPLYHGTSEGAARSIQREGLKPNQAIGSTGKGDYAKTFLSNDKNTAFSFASRKGGADGYLLKIKPTSDITEDLKRISSDNKKDFIIYSDIPVENIEIQIPDGNWVPISKYDFYDKTVLTEAIGPVYHGSPNKFEKFSYDYMGKIGTSAGYGFYFTTDKSIAEKYAEGTGNLYTANLDINKPLNSTKITITKNQLAKFLKVLDPDATEYLSNWGDIQSESYNNILRTAIENEYEGSDNDVDLISGIINADGRGAEEIYRILTKTLGYDGIIAQPDWVGEHKIVIPFFPEQIKLVK